jgi:hypothetical protein
MRISPPPIQTAKANVILVAAYLALDPEHHENLRFHLERGVRVHAPGFSRYYCDDRGGG